MSGQKSGSQEKLSNPFSKDKDGFLGFSASTPEPSHSNRGNFIPKRGKMNRQGNWERFGDYMQSDERNQGRRFSETPPGRGGFGNFRGSPRGHFTPRGFRGSHSFQGSPENYRGHPRGTPGGQFRGTPGGRPYQSPGNWNRGRGNFSSNSSYFHPSMLEDPWAGLPLKSPRDASFSDSLVVNPNHSILDRSEINPAPDVSGDYSSGDEVDGDAPLEATGDVEMEPPGMPDRDTQNELSDSLVPLVGDSFVENDMSTL